MTRYRPVDLRRVRTYSLRARPSKVPRAALARTYSAGGSFREWLETLPRVLAGEDFRVFVRELALRHRRGKVLLFGLGAHVLKVGLGPLVVDLLEKGVASAVAMNGAAAIHDFELAFHGETSEDVERGLRRGSFGMARETGRFLNEAARRAWKKNAGFGAELGRTLVEMRPPFLETSILAAAARKGVPATVHVAIGTDIVHMHPSADGAAIGAATMYDFRLLAGVCRHLDGGAYLNVGSAVVLPETFLKALNLARNLGSRVANVLTADLDFVRQYRPRVNVVERPSRPRGRGYQFVGHHEILFPLLYAALLEEISELEGPGARTAELAPLPKRRSRR